jgi:glycosyltransferase involved in cell wall biosynthesis
MVASKIPPAYGGAGAQAVALARQLVGAGQPVVLLAQRFPGEARRQHVDGVDIRLWGSSERPKNALTRARRTLWFMLAVVIEVLRSRPRIVHLHGCYWFTVAAALTCRIRRVPFIVKVTRLGEDDPASVQGRRVGPLPIGWLYGFPFRHTGAMIAMSEEIAEAGTSSPHQIPIRRIPNGVDTHFFRPPSALEREAATRLLGLIDGGFRLVQSGYVVPHKGTGTLLDAWALCQESLGSGSTLLLAGPYQNLGAESDDRFTESIIASADRLGNVRLLGLVDRETVRACFWASDCFALVSHYEGLPNSLLEAIACGLPVIVTRIPGIVDVVASLDGARLVPVGDSALTAAAITSLLELPSADRCELGGEARSLAVREYGLEAVRDKYLNLYDELSGLR